MKRSIQALIYAAIALQQAFCGTLKMKNIHFDAAGVPLKIRYIFTGSVIDKEYPPSPVAITKDRIHYFGRGDQARIMNKNDKEYEMEVVIDIEALAGDLGDVLPSDWTLSVRGDPKVERIADVSFIHILTIKDSKIGLAIHKKTEQVAPIIR